MAYCTDYSTQWSVHSQLSTMIGFGICMYVCKLVRGHPEGACAPYMEIESCARSRYSRLGTRVSRVSLSGRPARAGPRRRTSAAHEDARVARSAQAAQHQQRRTRTTMHR